MNGHKFTTVDEYIASFSEDKQKLMQDIRAIIKKAAPKAEEVISYNMPAYKMNSVLVYFGGGKEHIGFYPTGAPIVAFADVLTKYKTSKGAIQLPLDKPIPKKLVTDIVKFRLAADAETAAAKKKKTK